MLSISQNKFNETDTTYIFNHVHLILSYHEGTAGNDYTDGRLLRARVQLASCDSFPCSENSKPMVIPKPGLEEGINIPYTYTVEFEASLAGIIFLPISLPLLSITPSPPHFFPHSLPPPSPSASRLRMASLSLLSLV